MSTTLAVEELRMSLSELLDQLQPGDEIILTRHQQPVAKLIGEQPKPPKRPEPGLCKGMITIVADDEEHLKDFVEYMP
jgi:antitoxin (DNA-binding transcriptional repressor) of toxin-antitoxin stability system